IENVSGSAYGDSISGSNLGNVLSGLDGADTLRGLGGDDTLVGGTGADQLFGGAGNDVYSGVELSDVVTELAGEGIDTVTTALAAYTLGDHLENLSFIAAGAFAGTGNAEANTISSVGGNGAD